MSRIGKEPVKIEESVEVNITGKVVLVKGALGEITVTLPKDLDAKIENGELLVSRKNELKQSKSDHGTYARIIANAVAGVKNGFVKTLELVGVGYRARMDGDKLVMSLGWNHPVTVEPQEGIKIEVPEETKVIIKGYDKQKVGEFAARVREIKKPEPYKGKGIRYEGEYIKRKSSKSSVA
ncbi:MAG: 50S ribosomal protein L6 [Candidatus Dojkabacteria bacterium]